MVARESLAPGPAGPSEDGSLAGSSPATLPLPASLTSMGSDIIRKPGSTNSTRWLLLSAATVCVVAALATITLTSKSYSPFSTSLAESANNDNLDQRLAQSATTALGNRRGTVIVMDPQTGRVQAVVNPEIAFEANLPPGSTIKPFTALAALKSGVIDETSQTLCGEKYSHEGFQTVCSHPRDLAPLNPTEAIAYSCNYYFGKVGERLNESIFVSTLAEFGFGKASGINPSVEGQGRLPRNSWHSENAIGESVDLQATPIQLLDAYAALVNGGHLFTPRVAPARGYVPELRSNVVINNGYRSLIVKGMRGAVRYGTAETAGLYSLPVYIFGKTGTATQINGFRSQGWFVGFASLPSDDSKTDREPAPENVKLAVLVFLAKAHGSEAAQVARPIFEEYARIPSPKQEATDSSRSEAQNAMEPGRRLASPSQGATPAQVRVHLVRENITRTMSLEDYVLGVVAAEGSTESEPEALKALAIASRTYALRNLGRHSADGYDFCTTTHCQRFRTGNPDANAFVSSAAVQAVRATKGEVLLDAGNQVADSYFSASCGGATANMTSLWGGKAPPYLKGLPDEYCATDPHHNWTDVISAQQLLKATQSDPRTNVGNRLESVRVLRQDASGRAELIAIEGERRVVVKGWDFKIIVGRALGWNLLKSSRFQISRAGANFVFHGSGFGHGLGLCQEGAHVMATRGANYRQILGKYFPGTTVEARIAEQTGRSSIDAQNQLDSFAQKVGIPPTAVGGFFRSRLQLSARLELRKSHQRELVDCSSPALLVTPHTRNSNFAGPSINVPNFLNPACVSRLDLNHPPTAVGGIWIPYRINLCRSNLNNPPTAVGGISEFLCKAELDYRAMGSVPESPVFADLLWNDHEVLPVKAPVMFESRRLTLSSKDFRISYPANLNPREIDALLRFLQASRGSLVARISGAGVAGQFPSLEVFINETTGDFVGRTGQPPWTAAATKGNRIELQPLATLKRRRILETTLRHELVHVLVDRVGHGRTPRWLAEGLAIHLAGEGRMVARYQPRQRITIENIENQLLNAKSANDMKVAYAAAYSEVKRIINTEGEANVWRRVAN